MDNIKQDSDPEVVLEVRKLFLLSKPPREQLHFWQLFRTTHREKIAKTQAPLCPDLLAAVDAHIERLKKEV